MRQGLNCAAVLSGCAFVFASCRDVPTSTPGAPLLDIKDAVHSSGNPHFFFLPPMVPDPSPTGTFDGTLAPVVQICIWNGSECGADLEIYNTETGPGSETVRVVLDEKHYIVNWHTDDILTNFPLAEGEAYRIRVIIGAQELGHADVDVVENGGQLRNVDTNEYIGLIDGQTLAIKFRIEEGAVEEGQDDIVSAGRYHSCTVVASGHAYCWGRNGNGQLGAGYRSSSEPTPVAVTGGHTFQAVSAGRYHTCGVTMDGAAYCWGYNAYGQLGNGSRSPSSQPTPVTGGHTFRSVTAGRYYTCGVTTDGDGYCWGHNAEGQLGIGYTSNYHLTPVAVSGGHKFQYLNALHHTCGLSTDGTGLCWGWNYYGQVGDGTDITTGYAHVHKLSPTVVGGGHGFRSLDAGWEHTCGVTTGGTALCWGWNFYGQLGDGTFLRSWPYNRPNPTAVTGGLSFQRVSAGGFHSCGLATDGTAHCWGANWYGQLGDGTATGPLDNSKASPVAVIGGQTFQSVSASFYHACGATTASDAYCWGWNRHGQVGDGTYTNRSSPVFTLDLDPPTP